MHVSDYTVTAALWIRRESPPMRLWLTLNYNGSAAHSRRHDLWQPCVLRAGPVTVKLIETAFTDRTAHHVQDSTLSVANSRGGRWRREGHIVRLDVRRATPCVLADSTRHATLERARVEIVLAIRVAVPPYGEVRRTVRSAAATASCARTARWVLHPARAIRRCGHRQSGRGRWRRRRRLRP